ncbi:MAG: membrane-bound lytic murein transglycosylase B [Granulosicoccus sp.]|jgi:membrane-bound lytic murein transglycosylase B
MKSFRFRMALVALLLSLLSPLVSAENYLLRSDVREYLKELSAQTGIDQNYLAGLFVKLLPQRDILDAISKPAERTLTWREYRPIFLTDRRIQEGRSFIVENRALLQRASEAYGVSPQIIAAIIGVETFYGRITGKHGVLESLATLAFDYPPRAKFFKRELTEFLVLATSEGWPADKVLGSYAGAMGVPQFISSSYREYAVDFDGDGKRDLFGSTADVVGSVANYLAVHGWVKNAPVAERWISGLDDKASVRALVTKSLKPVHTAQLVTQTGFKSSRINKATSGNQLVSVMTMNGQKAEEFWVGYQNFYVITRYNHSRMYALAVYQLARALDRADQ